MASKKKKTKKSEKLSTVPANASLAGLAPEQWVPAQGWLEGETPDLPAELLETAVLPTESASGTAAAPGTTEQSSYEPTERERHRIRVGDTVWSWIRRIPLLIRLMIILAVLGALVYVYGLWQRGEIHGFLYRVYPGRQPSLTLLDAHGEYVLMVETDRTHSQVLVQISPQGNWLRISRDDLQAVNPSFSPAIASTIKYVAYLSLQNERQIVVAPLDDTADRLVITATDLEAAAVAGKTSDITFCEWTPLAWDPEGHRIAFFGCRREKPRSLAFSARVDADPVELDLVSGSEADTADPRQLQWSGTNYVVLTVPSPKGEWIKTLSVP